MTTALVLACDDNFIAYTSCVARRIVALRTDKFPILILADQISQENKDKALTVCNEIEFIDVDRLFEGRDFPVQPPFTRASCARLLLDEILFDFDKAVYMDSDLSILADITPLLSTELRTAPVAAAHDLQMYGSHRALPLCPITPGKPYFNSGVAVYDLKAIRAEGIFRQAEQFCISHPDRCPIVDQDALNHVLDGRWQVLDWRWNALSFLTDSFPDRPHVRHLAGNKPWSDDKSNIEPDIVSMWRDDLANSPWPHLFLDHAVNIRRTRNRWLKSRIDALLPGWKGRSARFRRGIAQSYREIERTVGQLATPLL